MVTKTLNKSYLLSDVLTNGKFATIFAPKTKLEKAKEKKHN